MLKKMENDWIHKQLEELKRALLHEGSWKKDSKIMNLKESQYIIVKSVIIAPGIYCSLLLSTSSRVS